MKICLDARGNHFGGVYTYTYSLLRQLPDIDSEFEYLVLFDQHQVDEGRLLVAGLEYRTIPVMSPLKMVLWNNYALGELLGQEKIDLYHGLKHFGLRRPRKRHCRMIWTLHSASWWFFPELFSLRERLFWMSYYRWGARLLDHVICVSHADRRAFTEAVGVMQDKVSVTQLAADERFRRVGDDNELASVRQRYRLPDRYILFVGTIYPFKNVETVLEVFARASDKAGVPHELLLVGDVSPAYGDRYKRGLEGLAERLGITNRVRWMGKVFDDLPAIYSLADVLLFPSLFESFGLPTLEAMACGVPVVASNVPGLQEVVADAGLSREPRDVEGLTDDVASIVTDDQLSDRLSREGLERSRRFSWERCARETVQVYRNVLGASDADDPHKTV